MSKAEKLYFTERDFEALDEILEKYPTAGQNTLLERELARGSVVSEEDIPANVITLHSRARVLDESTSTERELTVVPPGETEAASGRVSVLAPLGAAVIGLSEGQTIEWPMPSGGNRRFRVARILFQPEAARRANRDQTPPSRHSGSGRGKKQVLSVRMSDDLE